MRLMLFGCDHDANAFCIFNADKLQHIDLRQNSDGDVSIEFEFDGWEHDDNNCIIEHLTKTDFDDLTNEERLKLAKLIMLDIVTRLQDTDVKVVDTMACKNMVITEFYKNKSK